MEWNLPALESAKEHRVTKFKLYYQRILQTFRRTIFCSE